LRRYERVTATADLARVASAPESWEVDFKSTVDPAEWWELAKDIAAFASYLGGVILVGATEQTGQHAILTGIASDHALRVAEAYRQAARRRCRPVPNVETLVLTLDGTDQVVVAVNVDPLPDQPVAAQFYRKDSNGKAVPEDAWRFPIRVGSHTDFIDPARLPMYINPHIRRMVIHLHSVPSDAALVVIWRRPSNQFSEDPVQSWSKVKEVNLGTNAVKLNVTVSSDSNPVDVQVPVEDVEAVWEVEPGKWAIRITGFFDGGKYLKNPSNAVIRR
jgi:hypothetical protein